MATTKRESSLGKEKKGTSPLVASIPHGQIRPSAGSTGKQVPNYLRPTISSRNDAKKKTGAEDTSQRPNLLRRRSLDRPTSAARVHKELISPGREKATAVRSASFSPKSSAAPKATLERVPKKPNGKPQTLSSSKSMNNTTGPTTKKRSTSVSKKPPSSHDKKEAQNLETKHENGETILEHRVEEIVKCDQGEIGDFEIPKAEENEHQDVINTTEVMGVEEGKDNPQHIPTVSQEQNVPQTEEMEDKVQEGKDNPQHIPTVSQEQNVPQTEEMEDKVQEGKSDHTQHDEDKENDSKEEIVVDHDHQEKIPREEAKLETEDEAEAKDNATEEAIATKEIGEEKQFEIREENGEGSQQSLESTKEEKVEESKPEGKKVVAKSQVQAAHGKKESPTPYNDVIEETASKLREERKNKVRALVGAFETVIDKETSNAK